ncbi:hypothetical protein A4X13_0g7958, partial [Tilletia indica]
MASQHSNVFTKKDLPILLPDFHTWMAREHPEFVVRKEARFSQDQVETFDENDDSQWRTVTSSEFAKLVDAAAFLLGEDHFTGWPLRTAKDPADLTPPKVAAFFATEMASVVTLEGFIKRGIATLAVSPRNTPDVLITMLVDQDIEYLTYAPQYDQLAVAIAAKLAQQHPSRKLALAELPTFERLSSYAAQAPFPYDMDTSTEFVKPVLYVHTSGSSGTMPTICPYSHEILLKMVLAIRFEGWMGKSLYCGGPLFHLLGQFCSATYAGTSLQTIITPPLGPPMMGSQLATFLAKSKADSAVIVPQQIDSLMDVPEGLDVLQSLDHMTFGGAALRRSTKEKLDEAKVNYVSGYGLSEVTAVGMSNVFIRPAALDGEWLHPLDSVKLEFEPYSEASDDLPALYTLIARHGYLPCAVTNIEDGYDTGDLVERHPDYPEWFKVYGRKSSFVSVF